MLIPASFVGIMQPLRNILINRFIVNYGFQGIECRSFHKTPVILFCVFFDRIITISLTLAITAMSALEHIKIKPFAIIKPSSRSSASTRVESHQMIFVLLTDAACQSIPNFRFLITANIATDNPDNVRIIFIAVHKKFSISHCFFLIH